MSYETLERHRRVWREKQILRWIYQEWYDQMMKEAISGRILEIGSGTASIRDFYPQVITSDITFCPWLDVISNGVYIPFKNETFSTVLALDVLHHIEIMHISMFIDEVSRVLKAGGRFILLEPYISPFSYLIYNFLHPEPVDLNATILQQSHNEGMKKDLPQKEPWDSNQAIPKILFWREEQLFKQRFPHLAILKKDLLSFFAYPLSGGYDYPSLIPSSMFSFFQTIERTMSWAKSFIAFRTFVVIEKTE